MGTITMSEKEILRLEIFNKLSVRRLNQSDVANLLSVSKRQVKRLLNRYKTHGAKGLISRKRGKRSNNRLSEDLKKHGRPLSFYTDKHSVFRVNRKGALSDAGLTQFGHAMKRLDIKLLYANTPQAKGRVERSNRVLQDRLVKKLRLLDISTMEAANAYLPTFCF